MSMLQSITKLDNESYSQFEAYGIAVKVEYNGRQAFGDDGKPVLGDTVGNFIVTWPGDRKQRYEHGPGRDQRFMTACRVEKDVLHRIFQAKYAEMASVKA